MRRDRACSLVGARRARVPGGARARARGRGRPSASATTTRSSSTNLHRQILFGEADVGAHKVDAAARALPAAAPGIELRLHRGRLLPDDAVPLVREYDVVLEGSRQLRDEVPRGRRVRDRGRARRARLGRALGRARRSRSERAGRPCYRCLFEDVPVGADAPNCAEAGVMGPVVGVVAAAQVDLALALLAGREVAGQLVTFDGRTGVLRRRTVPAPCRLPALRRCAPHPPHRTRDLR